MNAIINYIHVLNKKTLSSSKYRLPKGLMCLCQSQVLGLCRQARKSRRYNMPLRLYAFMTILFLERDANTEGFIYIICCEFELSFKKLKIYPQKYHIKDIQDFYDRLIDHV